MFPVSDIHWDRSSRIVSTRYPPSQLFEDVARPAELAAVVAIESLTNPRIRQEVGELDLVAEKDRVAGPGTSVIMAAFTHRNRGGSRFSDGSHGVYYAGRTMETAVRETVHHTAIFLGYSNEPPMDVDMRVHYANLKGRLHDIRGSYPELHDPNSYAASQAAARKLRAHDSYGIVYDSVRHSGGQCVGIFRPPVLAATVQGPCLSYRWDGERITHYYEKGGSTQL